MRKNGGGTPLRKGEETIASVLKRAGYDALIIEGKADKPVYLFIQDGEVSIRDASKLWVKKPKRRRKRLEKSWVIIRLRSARLDRPERTWSSTPV